MALAKTLEEDLEELEEDLEGDPEVSARVLIASRRMLEGFDTHRETTRTDDFLCL